ncbi:MAG: FtsL-like putative cell division protein [Paludibacter sp.]|nr:FtsL-like putative cell division protein [Paludibacter sp.]
MNWIKNILETIKGNEDFTEIKSSSFRDFLNGTFFTNKFFKRQIILIIMIFLLIIFYVDNRYYCEKQLYTIIELEKKIKDVKYESLTISAQLMKITRQSNIVKMVNERGINLTIIKTPPIVIDTTANSENPVN